MDRKETIEYAMQQATGNPYWRLNPTEIKRWEREILDEVRELAAQRARIAQEAEQAKGYKSRFFHLGSLAFAHSCATLRNAVFSPEH